MPTTNDGVETRRDRQRRQLLDEIETEARRLLEEGGSANVTVRAIARGVGIGPASLYTYFDSLDDVFTMLLLSSYRRLAAAIATAVAAFVKDPPIDRAAAGIFAHRRWSLANRNEFNLIFSDLLPGYAAPTGGPTVAAETEVFQPLVDALGELPSTATRHSQQELTALVWTAFHGAVALEVNHHLDWIADPAALHEQAVRNALAGVGLPQPSSTIRKRFDRWATKP